MCMTNNKYGNSSLPTPQTNTTSYHLQQIISSDPILSQYFRMNSPIDRYYSMAHQLMLDGIRYRTNAYICNRQCCCKNGNVSNIPEQNKVNVKDRSFQQNQQIKIPNSTNQKKLNPSNQKNKHYNVSYIKHNRFLSPKQKKQIITPKVTQIIPVKSQPLIIYGKPRVKVDNQFGCPYHNNQQECLAIPYGSCQPKTPRPKGRQIHVRQNNNSPNKEKNFSPDSTKKYNELSKYKSTPNLIQEIDRRELPQELNKTKKNYKKPQNMKKQKNGRQSFTKEVPGQTIYVDRIIQVQSRVPGKMRYLQSPKSRTVVEQYDPSYSEDQTSYLVSRYDSRQNNQRSRGQQTKRDIQSKIKFLIDRDKKNKALEKHMKKQEQRIKNLQTMIKSEKQQKKSQKPKIKIQANDILSLSSSSSSEMTLLNSNLIDKFKKKGDSGRKEKLEVQSQSKQFNRKGSARFGVKDQILDQNLNIQLEDQQNCQCSKTLNGDSQDSSINQNDQSGESEPFSDFHG